MLFFKREKSVREREISRQRDVLYFVSYIACKMQDFYLKKKNSDSSQKKIKNTENDI